MFKWQHIRHVIFVSLPRKTCLASITKPKVPAAQTFSIRSLSVNYGRKNAENKSEISDHVKPEEGAITVGQKVKQAGKDVSYIGILLFGFGVAGALVWYVANELLFGFSSNAVYSKALDIIKNSDYVIATYEVGDGMKGYGEETSRGRRRHVSFQEYVVDGVNHMRIQFYVSGNKRKATVHAEARETSRGKFEFRYIFLELQGLPPSKPIIIVDNR